MSSPVTTMGVLTHSGGGSRGTSPADHHDGSPGGRGVSPSKGGFSSATIGRARPKLPHLDQRCSTLSPERVSSRSTEPTETTKVQLNLEEAFSDLSNTDFVSKYSRNANRRPSGTATPTPSQSSLPMSPRSPFTSPGTQTPPIPSEAVGGFSIQRVDSLRYKLTMVKESRDRAEMAGRRLVDIPRRRPGVVNLPTHFGTQIPGGMGEQAVQSGFNTGGRKSMPAKVQTSASPTLPLHSSHVQRTEDCKGASSGRDSSSEERGLDPCASSSVRCQLPQGSSHSTSIQGNNDQLFQRAWSEPSFSVGSRNRHDDNSEEEFQRESGPDTPPVSFIRTDLWQQRHNWSDISDRLKDPLLPASGNMCYSNQSNQYHRPRLSCSDSLEQSQDEASMSDDLKSKCSSTSTLKETIGSDEECFSRTSSVKRTAGDGHQDALSRDEPISTELINVIPEIQEKYGAAATSYRQPGDYPSHVSSSGGGPCSYSDNKYEPALVSRQANLNLGPTGSSLQKQKEHTKCHQDLCQEDHGEVFDENKRVSKDSVLITQDRQSRINQRITRQEEVDASAEGVDEGVGGEESDENETSPGQASSRMNELVPPKGQAPLCCDTEEESVAQSTESSLRRRKGMFLTHPPVGERKAKDQATTRSVDSNGLSSLRATSESVPQTGELTSQVNTSTDSHICPSDVGDEEQATYSDVVLNVMSEGNAVDKQERKNGKAVKQKSKSDPSGEKQKLKEIQSKERPSAGGVGSAQSSPILPERGGQRTTLPTPQSAKVRAKSEDILFPKKLHHFVDDESTKMSSEESQDDQPRGNIKQPERSRAIRVKNKFDREVKKMEQDFGKDTIHEPMFNSQPSSSPSTPRAQSPEPTLHVPQGKATSLSANLKQMTNGKPATASGAVNRSHSFAGRPTDPKPRRSPPDFGMPQPYMPKLEPIFSAGSTLSLLDTPASEKEKRDMIVEELVSTEQQYVYTLNMLVEKYMIPLKKTTGVIDSHLVDDIFYKINEIYMHHAMFLAFLETNLHNWDNANSTIGDVIQRAFSRDTVIENYTSFIENFPKAEKVLDDLSTKGTFVRFIDQIERETRSKLPLKAQIVKPAQRIPRYELLLRRLIENTPKDHPDYQLLLGAEEAIHKMALRINAVKNSKHEEDLQETLRKLEFLLVTDLIAPERLYHRHDIVQILNRKEQCSIWMFSDLAVFTSIKRKSGPVNRRSTILLQSPLGQDFVENVKHKVWLKIPLDDLDIIKGATLNAQKDLVDRDQLEEDFTSLSKVADLTAKIHTPHQNLDETLHELMSQINKQLSDHQLKPPPPDSCKVELMATTTEGVSNLTIVFPSPEKKSSWETAFLDVKQKLATLSNCRPPEFLQALQITKTRAGMQFSCAAPIDGFNANQQRDVWVCNSDGYVGHMCLLSLQPEPIVTLNTPVPGCNSRILCICAVPAFHAPKRSRCSRRVRKCVGSPTSPITIRIESLDGETEEEEEEEDEGEEEEEDDSMSDTSTSVSDPAYSEGEDSHYSTQNQPDRSRASPMHIQAGSSIESKEGRQQDMTQKGTMWLGTEDGCIHIFLCTDNIKTTKNKIKVQQNAGILGMIQIDQKVFVSLANGDLVIYQRNKEGVWDMTTPETITLGSANSPITKMLPVAGRLWCACQTNIIILNPSTLAQEYEFAVNLESHRSIQCIACSGLGVWLSGQNSSKVLLYHATTYEHLLEVSIAQAVAQKLQTADDIIRQHKTACLRITSLLTCKDLLWVGTSAGVVLTLVMPKVSASTSRPNINLPTVTGLVHGHTGHVRFLTSVEMPPGSGGSSETINSPTSVSCRRPSVSLHMLTLATKMLVISGGDGYEDFRNSGSNEAAGRDDSTNHLLLWQV